MSDFVHLATALEEPRDGLSTMHLKVLDDVSQYGFHYMMVRRALAAEHAHALSRADEEHERRWQYVPDWSYTIGLHKSYGHPEIVVFALSEAIVKDLLWDLARQIQSGRKFKPRVIYDDALPSFEGQRCAFEPVAPAWAPSLFGFARWFYRGADFPIVQYVWPDRFGHIGWESGATDSVLAAQPLLEVPPADADAPPTFRTQH